MADTILTETQLSAFCGSVAMLLRSGAPAGEAAALFARDVRGTLADAAQAVAEAMDAGQSFAEAAAGTGAFPAHALGVFRTAELSGRLEEALERLADYYDRQDRLNRRLRSALTYPVTLLLMMSVVLAVLVFGVIPMFRRVYDSLTGSVAASVYAYIPAAAVIGQISLIVTVLVCAVLLTLAVLLRRGSCRDKLRHAMETSFLTRDAARLLAVSNLTDTLSTLLASGMDPDSALSLVLEHTRHTRLAAELERCRERMEQGAGLAAALQRESVLPPLQGRMLVSGQESGQLSRSLEIVSRQLGREAEERLRDTIDRIEPVLTGFLTVAVGLTLLSVMLPLLGILGAV